MEASHKTHRPHIKVGKDEEEEEKERHEGSICIEYFHGRSGYCISYRACKCNEFDGNQ